MDLLLKLVAHLNTKLGLGDRAFLTLWSDKMLADLPMAKQYVAIRPARFPVWQSVVTGSGAEHTGFNGIVSLVCLNEINGDPETRSPITLTEESTAIVSSVMKVISAMQFWQPKDDDNNDLLREYGRLVDGGFGFQALTGKESTWSVSSTDWELKFTAKLPPL